MVGKIMIFLCCLLPAPMIASASVVSFEERYVYDAGEADSKLTCRAISLLEVKKLLLERLGTYVQSNTEVVNLQLTRDEVTTLSAGVVKTEIIDEKWDGMSYSLTARVEVDPDSVARMISELIKSDEGGEKIKQLESMNNEAVSRIEDLKQQMAAAQNDLIAINRDYRQAAKVIDSLGAFEKGMDQMREEKFGEAAESFSKAIEMDPRYNNYLMRGKAYRSSRKFDLALADFNKTLELKPTAAEALFQKGRVYLEIGDKRKGVELIQDSARQGNGKARLWLKSKGKSY
ncbi:MAG: tetratricopeptide repeat protein [Proteobacteria bacterium]|nr:tetratricopeptide repeat protein [Pseudomonadota bacterium]MBU1738514.1 tetratricopeptide repeat protein [Pseudomonadota bacterium]